MGQAALPSPNQWPPFVVVDLNFLDPTCTRNDPQIWTFTYLPALSPSPFDNEFAGSPAMTASGMAGHFILKNTIG